MILYTIYLIALIIALVLFLLKWIFKKTLKTTAYIGCGLIVIIGFIFRIFLTIFLHFLILSPIILLFGWIGKIIGGIFEGLGLLVGLCLGFYACAKLSKKIEKFLDDLFDKFI